jgi:hypothetical protein
MAGLVSAFMNQLQCCSEALNRKLKSALTPPLQPLEMMWQPQRGQFPKSPRNVDQTRIDMIENQKIKPAQVIGPLGEPLTLDSLPPPSTTRWVVRRKAEVVAAVNGGLLTIDEVCERYGLTLEEFASWQRAVDRSGMQGLRVTRIQHYRDLYERQLKF